MLYYRSVREELPTCRNLLFQRRRTERNARLAQTGGRPLTNGELIRRMTDKELVQKLYLFACVHLFDNNAKCKDEGCRKCWLNWLKKEAKQ